MNNFDLKKYLAEGKLNEAEMSFDSDIESKTNKNDFAFWYRAGVRGKKQALQAQELLKQNGIDADYSKGSFYIDFSNSNVEQRAVMQLLRDAGLTNFVVTNTVEEGQLNEAMSPQDVVDIADTVAEEFTKESADEGDFMIYSVGEMDVDDMTFELDTDTTAQTPERILKMSNLGVGEGWGGSFRINPKEEGYEVRNSEKGGLVAIIDGMGNFKMISADEARAEMGMADGEKTDFMQRRKETDDYIEEGEEEVKEIKSNKMKKSELKEMIKAAMSENARTDAEEEGYLDGMRDEKEDMKEAEDVEVEDNENVDVDIEKDLDVKVDDEESEVDIDVKASMPGESEDVEEVQALLMKAQEAAEALGDDKLQDQIGNTITYFTRAHVAGNVSEADLDMDLDSAAGRAKEATIGLDETEELDEKKQGYNDELDDSEGAKHGKKKQDMAQRRADSENMEKADGKRKYSGDKSKDLNESVVFPMWNKIK